MSADVNAGSSHWATLRAGRPRWLALSVTCALLALSVFAVSHIHGLSDPNTHHTVVDYLLFAQIHAGFLIALPPVILVLRVVVGWIGGTPSSIHSNRLLSLYPSRAPPTIPS